MAQGIIPERGGHWLAKLLGREYLVVYPVAVFYLSRKPRVIARVNALLRWEHRARLGFFRSLISKAPSPIHDTDIARLDQAAERMAQLRDPVEQ